MLVKYKTLTILLLLTLSSTVFSHNPAFMTNEPDSYGFDISRDQTPAFRFSPVDDFTLMVIESWFGNNGTKNTLTLRLHEDGENISTPGKIIEEWTIEVGNVGWNYQKYTLTSIKTPQLKHNERYWLVATSDSKPQRGAIWGIANIYDKNASTGFFGVLKKGTEEWETGYSGIPASRILGALPTNP